MAPNEGKLDFFYFFLVSTKSLKKMDWKKYTISNNQTMHWNATKHGTYGNNKKLH